MMLRFVLLRLGCYAVLTFAVFGAAAFFCDRLDRRQIFQENGPIEWLQFALLVAGALCCLWTSRFSQSEQPLFRVFALMLLCAAVREMDENFKRYVFAGAWQLLVATLLVWTAWIAWKTRATLADQINGIIRTHCFGLLFGGFLAVMVFSRLFGSGAFWKAVLQEDYVRAVNRVAEEGCELFGYLLLFFGCIEFVFRGKAAARTAQRAVPARRG